MEPSRENKIFELFELYGPQPELEVVMKTDGGWIRIEDAESAKMIRNSLNEFLKYPPKESGGEA